MASRKATVIIPRFLLPNVNLSSRTFTATPSSCKIAAAQNIQQRHHASVAQCQRSAARDGSCATPSVRPERHSTILSAARHVSTGSRSGRSSLALQRQSFSTTAPRPRDHHFDTLKFVQRLKEEGFSEEQAAAMMKVLSDVVEESIQNLTRTMVLREDQEKATYTQKVDFAKLRSELLSADSTESSLTRASHERLTNDLTKLNSRLRDEIQRTQASVRLDLNLEKGRIREEANSQDLKIKEVETRIEQETAALRERLEQVKFSTLQWLM